VLVSVAGVLVNVARLPAMKFDDAGGLAVDLADGGVTGIGRL